MQTALMENIQRDTPETDCASETMPINQVLLVAQGRTDCDELNADTLKLIYKARKAGRISTFAPCGLQFVELASEARLADAALHLHAVMMTYGEPGDDLIDIVHHFNDYGWDANASRELVMAMIECEQLSQEYRICRLQ